MLNMKAMPLGAYQTNCYILWGADSDSCVVIDPGYEPERVLWEIRTLGKEICAILLTHGHFDHVGAVNDLVADTGCRVFLNPLECTLPPQLTAGQLTHSDAYHGGETLHLAELDFSVLHTPGHTPGSVCLLFEDAIFSGDTLFQRSCGRTDFPGGDSALMKKSLQTLRALPKDYTVYPGHGQTTTLEQERRFNPYL